MTNRIRVRRTTTAGKVPTTLDLQEGELGLNTVDKKLYSSDGTNVFEIGGSNPLYSSLNTDITNLISGSTEGTLIEGLSGAHLVIGIRGNDAQDGFHIIDKANASNPLTDPYLNRLFSVSRSLGVNSTLPVSAPSFNGILIGNANTATTLQTPRTINGTSFNGSSDITTANWGFGRDITIGYTSKSVDGSGNVAWTLAEIGAAASTHNHTLAGLTDTTFITLTTGNFLRYNSTAWVNTNLVAGDIPNLDAAKITTGIFDVNRIPTGTTSTTVALGNHNHDSTYLSLTGGTLTGNITLNNQNQLRLSELTVNGTNFIALRSPATLASDIILTFPATLGTNGQVLSTDASGNLSWITLSINSTTLATLTDVTLTSLVSGNFLRYNGVAWVNSTDGSTLTTLNASNISSGTLADDKLSSNVVLLTGTQTISGTKTFSAVTTISNATASTSISNGALVVTGGIGTNNIYTNTLNVTAGGTGITTTGSVNVGVGLTTGASLTVGTSLSTAGSATIGTSLSTVGTGTIGTGLTVGTNITINNQGTLRLSELTVNGTNYVALRSPANLTSNITLTLPSALGTAGQVLSTDASGNLSWVTGSNDNLGNHIATQGLNMSSFGITNALSYNLIPIGRGAGNISDNIAIGTGTLSANTTGTTNTVVGIGVGEANTTGNANSGFGYLTLYYNTTGNNNSGFGSAALCQNTTGVRNTAIGSGALWGNTTNNDNTAIGTAALYNNGGNGNIAIGSQAGRDSVGSNILHIANNHIFSVISGTNIDSSTTATIRIAATTASNTTSSGALVVSGGVGVGGNLYTNGSINSTQNITGKDFIASDVGYFRLDSNLYSKRFLSLNLYASTNASGYRFLNDGWGSVIENLSTGEFRIRTSTATGLQGNMTSLLTLVSYDPTTGTTNIGGITLTATSFSGSGASLTSLNASNLASGTVPDARLTGIYSGLTLKIDGANSVFTTPNAGSSSSVARTVYGLAEYRSNAASQVGAIVFIAPNTTSSIMHQLEVSGLLYNQSIVRLTVQGYRTTGAWGDLRKISFGTVDVQTRWGVTPDGKNCLILGDVDTSWVYPHFSVIRAMFSHSTAGDAYCNGWTVAIVTNLSTYTNISGTITDSALVGSISGNAATATALQTTRTLTFGSTGKTFNGSANVAWTLAEIGAQAALNFTPVQQGGGTGQSTNKLYIGWRADSTLGLQIDATNFGSIWPININGTATTLQTARTIALLGAATGTATSFNGSANITIPVTALNASNLSSGTVPDARISGTYTGLTNLTGSGTATFTRFQATGLSASWGVTSGINTGGLNVAMGASTAATWLLSSTSGGVFRYGIQGLDSGNYLRFYAGANDFYFNNDILYANAFSGSGTSLTALNASNLASGTIPDARLTGAYTGLTNLTGSNTAIFAAFNATNNTGGRITISTGSATQAGLLQIYKNDGTTRLGYIGWSNTDLTYASENGAKHILSGGVVNISNTTASTSATAGALVVTGGISTSDDIFTTNLSCAAGVGNGISFWGLNSVYKIYMSASADTTFGGRLDTTSDYNIYFKIGSGTNRGFVFMNSTTPVAQIEGGGNLLLTGSLIMNGNVAIDAGGGWHRSYGNTGWYNSTHQGGMYMQDTVWVRTYNSKSLYSSSNLGVAGAITVINGISPANGAIRLTPALHLNAGNGVQGVIANWDNGGGAATDKMFRVGNGTGGEIFFVRRDGLTSSNILDTNLLQINADPLNRFEGNKLVIRGGSPTVILRDTDHNSAMIHCNANILYFLRGANDTESWARVGGQWPFMLNLSNNNATFGGAGTFTGSISAANISSLGGISPANGAIRLTPNLHLNSGIGSGIIVNWDSGAGVSTNPVFRVGNGVGGTLFTMSYAGNATISSNLNLGAAIATINGYSPAYGAIRMTPSLHLNSTPGYAIWINYDNGAGASADPVFAVGNGAGGTLFNINYNGYISTSSTIRFGNRGGVPTDGNCGLVTWNSISLSAGTVEFVDYCGTGGSICFAFYRVPNIGTPTSGNIIASINQAGTYTVLSDERVKKDIKDIEYGLNTVLALKPRKYNHYVNNKFNDGKVENGDVFVSKIGLIAQEVYPIIPEIVEKPENEKEGFYSLDYTSLIPVLIKAIQEQQDQIDVLKTTVKVLMNKLNSI